MILNGSTHSSIFLKLLDRILDRNTSIGFGRRINESYAVLRGFTFHAFDDYSFCNPLSDFPHASYFKAVNYL